MSKNPSPKSDIRNKIRQKRDALEQNERLTKNETILEHLEKLPEFTDAKTVLVYVAAKGEVDTHALIHKYLPLKTIAIPTVDPETHRLDCFHLQEWEELTEGHYGILEIHHDERQTIDLEDIDCIVVPGIAFDKTGYRIGYGKGYYDHLLKDFSGPTIGLAFDLQMAETIPTEPHDIPVKTIITETQIIHS